MNAKEISSNTIEWIDNDGEEVTEKSNCVSCFAPVLTSGLCANCTMIRQLWQEKLSLSQRLKEEVEVRNLALDQTIQLQMVIKDLSLRLQSQGQSLQRMPSALHKDERTQTMWLEHEDKGELQHTVDLTGADAPLGTVRHALSDFVHIIDPEKITHLCDHLCDQGKTMIKNCCSKIIGGQNSNTCQHDDHNQHDHKHSLFQNHVESIKPENRENSSEHHDDEHPVTYDNKLQDILMSESKHRHVASVTHEAICHWRQGPLYKAKVNALDEMDEIQERLWPGSRK